MWQNQVISNIGRYWNTIRFLRPKQLCYQIRRHFVTPRLVTKVPGKFELKEIILQPWPSRPKSYLGGGRFRFLNKESDMGWPINWSASPCSHLWQYNLHYFDFLHQPGLDKDNGLALIRSWIQGYQTQNKGLGWEPYPISLRLVNWIKFYARHHAKPSSDILDSIALHSINLKRQIEYHILGNHIFADGKALWFAGVFLGNEELTCLGRKIILQEIREQFLPDGGHFELSPMYHSLVLEDLLDLVNLCEVSGQSGDRAALPILRDTAGRALAWLSSLIDDEGKIPLLNDSAYGVASAYEELDSYAQSLGVRHRLDGIPETTVGNWHGWNLSGYRVLMHGPWHLLFDTAPLGPDYLLGHAHCDMLALLLDFEGHSIFGDTGVFEYEEGDCRRYARGTSAHNAVVLDGLEQAELWKSFRVGRRGYPHGFRQDGHTLRCGHTGFAIWRKGLFHERAISLLDNGFELKDQVYGIGDHHYQGFFHFAPGVRIEPRAEGGYLINGQLILEPWGDEIQFTTSEYYPEFGRIEERPCLVISGRFRQKTHFGLRCTYSS